MALGNLNCPIMLEVKPGGAGWAEVNMHIGKFLQIKGLALDKEIELVSDSQDEHGIFHTRLEQEMDLLIRSMS